MTNIRYAYGEIFSDLYRPQFQDEIGDFFFFAALLYATRDQSRGDGLVLNRHPVRPSFFEGNS